MVHEHHFGQAEPQTGETRTRLVVILTAATMAIEIVAGLVFGSMALLADGLHMASHASALGLAWIAYVYARQHAHDTSFSFGTGKVNTLAGFTSAVVLALFALMMAGESIHRFLEPVPIAFDRAIVVAVLGLVVNGVSVLILRERHDHAPRSPPRSPPRPQPSRGPPPRPRGHLDLDPRHRRAARRQALRCGLDGPGHGRRRRRVGRHLGLGTGQGHRRRAPRPAGARRGHRGDQGRDRDRRPAAGGRSPPVVHRARLPGGDHLRPDARSLQTAATSRLWSPTISGSPT